MKLPPSLATPSNERALVLLHAYYAPLSKRNSGYTGGQFDMFDPSGTRVDSADTFTTDDIVSLSLLSTPVAGRAAHDLLFGRRATLERLLGELGPDRDLSDEESVTEDAFAPAWQLWRELDDIPGLGATRVSKLMARKRPRLIPIFDSVLAGTVFAGAANHWEDLWSQLRHPATRLHDRLVTLRSEAGLSEEVSPLRVFDVCAWMDGTPNGEIELNLSRR